MIFRMPVCSCVPPSQMAEVAHCAPSVLPSAPGLQTLQKKLSLDPLLSKPTRSKYDLLVLPRLSIQSGQSLHFESPSRSSRWQSRRETEIRADKRGRWREAKRCQYRGTATVLVRARVGGVKGPRAAGTGADGPVLALKQSKRIGDTGKRNFPGSPPPPPIGPLGFQRKERGKWGDRL